MGDEAKDEKPDTINLKVVAQDGNEIFFKCAAPRHTTGASQDSTLGLTAPRRKPPAPAPP